MQVLDYQFAVLSVVWGTTFLCLIFSARKLNWHCFHLLEFLQGLNNLFYLKCFEECMRYIKQCWLKLKMSNNSKRLAIVLGTYFLSQCWRSGSVLLRGYLWHRLREALCSALCTAPQSSGKMHVTHSVCFTYFLFHLLRPFLDSWCFLSFPMCFPSPISPPTVLYLQDWSVNCLQDTGKPGNSCGSQ